MPSVFTRLSSAPLVGHAPAAPSTSRARTARSFVALLALVAATAGVSACRVNNDDLVRWRTAEHGPDKLAAVLTHDKYDMNLRVEAAWTLVEMKKRGGETVGVDRLLGELANMQNAKDRGAIIEGLWKRLQPKVLAPVKKLGEGKFTDESVVYKDATFRLYTAARQGMSTGQHIDIDKGVLDQMAAALGDWATGKDTDDLATRLTTFETRLENPQQATVEKVLGAVGVTATKRAPALLKAPAAVKSQHLDTIVNVVCDVKGAPGDADYEKARAELAANIAQILDLTLSADYNNPATYVGSIRGEMDEALKKAAARKDDPAQAKGAGDVLAAHDSKETDPTKNPYLKYMLDARNERMQYVFTQAKKAAHPGSPDLADPQKKPRDPSQAAVQPLVDALFKLAKDDKAPKEYRAFALAALEGNFPTNDDNEKLFLDLAQSNAEDEVKHGAIVRLAEYDPPTATKAYYSLFSSPNWKVRFDAAAQVLGLLKKAKGNAGTSVREFLDKLPGKPDPKVPFALGEPGTYGGMLFDLPPELKAKETVLDIMNKGPGGNTGMGAELTALGWFFANGDPADLPLVDKFSSEKDAVPKCDPKDDCKWDNPAPACAQGKAGMKWDEIDYNVSFRVLPPQPADPKNPAPPPIDVKCTDSIKSLGDKAKGTDDLDVKCPANCTTGGIWGTQTDTSGYTTDSAICVAAVHAGALKDAGAGVVHVHLTDGLTAYKGSKANGVTSQDWLAYPKLETIGDYAGYCVKAEINRRAADKASAESAAKGDKKEQPK